MLRAPMAVVGLAILVFAVCGAEENKRKEKDPPKEMSGPIKRVDKEPGAASVTITVKEKRPTSKEDVLQDVEKDYRFRIVASTKIIGLDGKPDKQGLKSLQTGDPVRIEFKNDVAVEVKKLPPN
jgi:hypothetical protein